MPAADGAKQCFRHEYKQAYIQLNFMGGEGRGGGLELTKSLCWGR